MDDVSLDALYPKSSVPAQARHLALGLVPRDFLHATVTQNAWVMLKDYIAALAAQANEEAWHLLTSVNAGDSALWVAYEVEKEMTEAEQQNHVWTKLSKADAEGLVGYTIIRKDLIGMFVWHLFLTEKYRGTEMLHEFWKRGEEYCKRMGSPAILFNSSNQAWHAVAEKMGFERMRKAYSDVIYPKAPADSAVYVKFFEEKGAN